MRRAAPCPGCSRHSSRSPRREPEIGASSRSASRPSRPRHGSVPAIRSSWPSGPGPGSRAAIPRERARRPRTPSRCRPTASGLRGPCWPAQPGSKVTPNRPSAPPIGHAPSLLPKPAVSSRTCCPRPGVAPDRPDSRAIDAARRQCHTGAPGRDPTFLLTIRARLRSMGTLRWGPGRAPVFLTAKECAVRRPIEVATVLLALLGAAAGNVYGQGVGQAAPEQFVLSGVVVFDGGGGLAWLQEPTLTQNRVIALRPGESIGSYRLEKIRGDRVEVAGPGGTVLVPL